MTAASTRKNPDSDTPRTRAAVNRVVLEILNGMAERRSGVKGHPVKTPSLGADTMTVEGSRPHVRWMVLGLLLAACGAPAVVPSASPSTTPPPPDASTLRTTTTSQGVTTTVVDDCADVSFRFPPIDFDAVDYIIPMGTHSEFKGGVPIPKIYLVMADISVAREVRTVADSVLYQVLYRKEPDGRADAGVSFAVCGGTDNEATLGYSYGHVTELPDWIMQLIEAGTCDTAPEGSVDCRWEGQVEVAAGELVGHAGGAYSRAAALDFMVVDRRFTADLIGPPTFYNGMENNVCPVDLYDDPGLVAGFQELLARSSVWEPLCGTVDFDLVGKLQGPWFHPDDLPGARLNQARVVGFWPSVVGAEGMGVVTSPPVDSKPRYFVYGEGSHNTDPSLVAPGTGVHCYDGFFDHPLAGEPVDGHILVRMESPGEITLAEGPGPCPEGEWVIEDPQVWVRP